MARKVMLIGFDGMMMPMLKRFLAEGLMPNMAGLVARGVTTELYNSFPVYTPTNWATLQTGAHTGTHDVPRWFIDLPGGGTINSFLSLAPNAETIFEAAERAGRRSVAFHYPATMPSRLAHGFVVEGFAHPAYGASPFEITPARCYTTLAAIPNADRIHLVPATGWRNLPDSRRAPLEATLRILTKRPGQERRLWLLVIAASGEGYDRVLVCPDRDAGRPIATARPGAWSEWAFAEFEVEGRRRVGTLRFKLIELSADGSRLHLYRTQVNPTDGFTEPEALGPELIERCGPYLEHASDALNFLGAIDFPTALEEIEYQGHWIGKATGHMFARHGCSLAYCHIHHLDYINHHHLSGADPACPGYDPSRAAEHLEAYRQSYVAVDRIVGTFLRAADAETAVVVLSDHGSVPDARAINYNKVLVERGFLALRDGASGLERDEVSANDIDWDKTQAYMRPGRGLEIFINARTPEEYERIQDALIVTLRTWVDEATGRTPIAVALRKRDAHLLGFWGEQCGDVVFVNEFGYMHGYFGEWGGIKGGLSLGEPEWYGAHHGPQLPTARTAHASNLGCLVMAGPGVKRGYERPAERLGHVHMTQVVPTLCHLLGIEPPRHVQGAVAYDLLEGWDATRARETALPDWAGGTGRGASWGGEVWVQRDMFDFRSHREREGR
jgi:hypothetical protein